MNTQEFLDRVLPVEGKIILGVEQKTPDGSRSWHKYIAYDSTYEAAAAAEQFDQRGETVYFGVNGYGDWYEDPRTGKKRIRTKANVVACRSLFEDLDVNPDKDDAYDTRASALTDIGKLAKALNIQPTVVSSGGGFHVYIHVAEDFTPQEWAELRALKRTVTAHLGMKVDLNAEKDVSRVLRPVGTHNRKGGAAREVRAIFKGKTYSLEYVRNTLQEYIDGNRLEPISVEPIGDNTAVANWFAAAAGEHPPSDADLVAERCQAIADFKETGCSASEPHWYKSIGVVKYCVDGEDIAHEWSKQDSGYTEEETSKKIAQWSYGPTTCDEFDAILGCKADCPFAGKCRSPIQLGYPEDLESRAEVSDPAQDVALTVGEFTTIEGRNIPYWPRGYSWNGSAIRRVVRLDEGNVDHRPFCTSLVYPIDRIRDSEGVWNILWAARRRSGDWFEFMMPTSELAAPEQMAKTLASQEVFLTQPATTARKDMTEFATNLVGALQAHRKETKTYSRFGWTDDYTGFVIGTRIIKADGEYEILLDDKMPNDFKQDFGTSGTLEEWVENIDFLFNRPGAEPFQFALCHVMGSLLVELVGSSNWHGMPVALVGGGGTGKTTGCKIANGFFARPGPLDKQGSDAGSTLAAAIARVSLTGSLPVLMDEFSQRTPAEMTRTGYALANGRDKERLNSSGRFATTGDEWYKNSLITSNDSIAETIATLPAGYVTEATQLRFFEVTVEDKFLEKRFADVEQNFVEHHMDNVYGVACRPFILHIINNLTWTRRQLSQARAKLNPKNSEETKERFYRDCIVTAIVAGKIAERLGLIRFDINALRKWAEDQVLRMRSSRAEVNTNIDEHVAAYIASLTGRLIVTQRLGDARTERMKEEPLTPINRPPAVGRICTEIKRAFVTVQSVTQWCKDNRVTPSVFKEELDRLGYIKHTADGSQTLKMYIGVGTSVPSGQAVCYELDYDKLFYGEDDLLAGGDK